MPNESKQLTNDVNGDQWKTNRSLPKRKRHQTANYLEYVGRVRTRSSYWFTYALFSQNTFENEAKTTNEASKVLGISPRVNSGTNERAIHGDFSTAYRQTRYTRNRITKHNHTTHRNGRVFSGRYAHSIQRPNYSTCERTQNGQKFQEEGNRIPFCILISLECQLHLK
jgi:hypothetical protein